MKKFLSTALLIVVVQSVFANPWWSDSVDHALARAGTNRDQLVRALGQAPTEQRDGLQFLVTNMPDFDLTSLSSDFLLHHLAMGYSAYAKAPWRGGIPKEIFLNDILPYACINETRDDSAEVLATKCAPLVADCQTSGAAAQRLNEKLFDLVNVHYNTKRPKSTQSPLESMSCHMATCTGLSILLVDACRLAGVPARVVGIPNWIDNRGNHTWVEVWDNGRWHFLGASEPDPKGLDHAWFEHDASLARGDEPEHAIYAASFWQTGLAYPLDWGVNVVNVTDRYARRADEPDDRDRLLVTVVDKLGGRRVAAQVAVCGVTNLHMCLYGISRDEKTDQNSALAFQVPRGLYDVRAEWNGMAADREFTAGTNRETSLAISMTDTPVYSLPAWATNYAPPAATPLQPRDVSKLSRALSDFFAAPPAQQAVWKFDRHLDDLLLRHDTAVRYVAWIAYKDAPIHDSARHDFDDHVARFDSYASPYTVKTVGERPARGWGLFIAMHGGGNAPKELNDSQWKIMQRYYRDQPQVGGYRYVALRAPNDTWNGFYDVYTYPLIDNLIRQFLLSGDVDPNKVFIMGYSHGGYGAFAIGPKEPDLFAAIHVSAAAPTDGETTAVTLRHTPFTVMVGELDTDYGRIERDRKFRDAIAQLRGDRSDIYPVTVKIIPGHHHSGLPDGGMIEPMGAAVRNPIPRDLTWLMTDRVITDFFWLRTDAPRKEEEIDASCVNNRVTVTTTNLPTASVMLDNRLVNFSQPVTLDLNGVVSVHTLRPSLRTLCQCLLRRGDPELAFTAELPLPLASPLQ